MQKGSRVQATNKGICLPLAEWQVLVPLLPSLCEALDTNARHTVPLGGCVWASVQACTNGPAPALDIREFQGPGGKGVPTQRGVRLGPTALKVRASHETGPRKPAESAIWAHYAPTPTRAITSSHEH